MTNSPIESDQTADRVPAKLVVRNLNFYYGGFRALDDISMTVYAERVTALIGSSGCGKTTLLRTFNRMHEVVRDGRLEGEILLGSENLLRMDVAEVRRRVGMVFQTSNPFPKSIFDNVAYGPRIQGQKNRRMLGEIVEGALRRAALWEELKDRLHRSAYELSGGERQRLCIARALAVEPEVLLLDEPCASLDPTSTAKIEELILNLKASCTIVIVTHNLQQARRVADFTAFFVPGRLIEFGATAVLFRNPSQEETRKYVESPFSLGRVQAG